MWAWRRGPGRPVPSCWSASPWRAPSSTWKRGVMSRGLARYATGLHRPTGLCLGPGPALYVAEQYAGEVTVISGRRGLHRRGPPSPSAWTSPRRSPAPMKTSSCSSTSAAPSNDITAGGNFSGAPAHVIGWGKRLGPAPRQHGDTVVGHGDAHERRRHLRRHRDGPPGQSPRVGGAGEPVARREPGWPPLRRECDVGEGRRLDVEWVPRHPLPPSRTAAISVVWGAARTRCGPSTATASSTSPKAATSTKSPSHAAGIIVEDFPSRYPGILYVPIECGNGVPQADEACDGGGMTADCDDDCTPAECGDGTLNESAGEICDDSGESPTCNADCTPATCGDAVVNAAAGGSVR